MSAGSNPNPLFALVVSAAAAAVAAAAVSAAVAASREKVPVPWWSDIFVSAGGRADTSCFVIVDKIESLVFFDQQLGGNHRVSW
mmetsp:Transcript_2563/g.5439  ORF Transcript_2563/g.5439 Transcript_2563/m.5439 type:complete len:84 (-) Transcript_2563:1323-1574(-)